MTTPERQARSRQQGRMPVNCSEHLTASGNSHMVAELGANRQKIPGLFLWCGLCRESHFLSLPQMFYVFSEMALRDVPLLQRYISVLTKAMSEVQRVQPEPKRNEAS